MTNKTMHFNPDKCEVMRITHRKDKTKPIYLLGGQFRSVENTKDLGVTISSDLSWGMHVFAMVNKANMVLGIIKRSIGTNNRDAFSQHLSLLDFFEFANSTPTRANHDYKLYLKRAVCNCYKYSFFIRIVRKWNDLPGYIVHAESLSVFKTRLKIYLNIY